jgi:hypothetical protein
MMLPDCVAYLRPKQLIKLRIYLYISLDVTTTTTTTTNFLPVHTHSYQYTPTLFYRSSYAISSVQIISILVYVIQHSFYASVVLRPPSPKYAQFSSTSYLNSALCKILSRVLSSLILAQLVRCLFMCNHVLFRNISPNFIILFICISTVCVRARMYVSFPFSFT